MNYYCIFFICVTVPLIGKNTSFSMLNGTVTQTKNMQYFICNTAIQHWKWCILPINISSLLLHSYYHTVCLSHCNLTIVFALLCVPMTSVNIDFSRLQLIYVKFYLITYVTLDHIFSIHVFLPKYSCDSCNIWYPNI